MVIPRSLREVFHRPFAHPMHAFDGISETGALDPSCSRSPDRETPTWLLSSRPSPSARGTIMTLPSKANAPCVGALVHGHLLLLAIPLRPPAVRSTARCPGSIKLRLHMTTLRWISLASAPIYPVANNTSIGLAFLNVNVRYSIGAARIVVFFCH